MKRRNCWAAALNGYLAARWESPFEWGKNDCVLFAWGAINVVLEGPVRLPVPGWSDIKSAAERLDEYGSAYAVMDGFESIHTRFVRTGDIVGLVIDGRPTLGVSVGGDIVGPGESGIVRLPGTEAVCAWRIGA